MSTSQTKQAQQEGAWLMGKGSFEQCIRNLEKKIKEEGVPPKYFFERFLKDSNFTQRVAHFMARSGVAESLEERNFNSPETGSPLPYSLGNILSDYSEISYKNSFLINDWIKYFGVIFEEEVIKKVQMKLKKSNVLDILQEPCPFFKDQMVLDTHMLFLSLPELHGEPLTLSNLQKYHVPVGSSLEEKANFRPITPITKGDYNKTGYNEVEFNHNYLNLELRLMVLDFVPFLTNKPYTELVDMLDKLSEDVSENRNKEVKYRVARMSEEVFKKVLFYKKNGTMPKPWCYGDKGINNADNQCMSLATDGSNIDVVGGKSGLKILSFKYDRQQAEHMGLAIARDLG